MCLDNCINSRNLDLNEEHDALELQYWDISRDYLGNCSYIDLDDCKSVESTKHDLQPNFKLSENQIEKLLKCRTPVHLKMMFTSVLLESFPGLDIDQALTNLTKFKIVNTTAQQTQRDAIPSLDLNAFLKTLALKRKMEVLVPKVGRTTVNRWTKKVPHWSLLDPYSDLEDEGSNTPTDEDTSKGDSSDRNCGVHFTRIGGHVLQRRTRSYSLNRTRCSETKFAFYRGMCTTGGDTKLKPNKKPRIVPLKHPSASRLEAQDRIKNGRTSDANKLIWSYPLFNVPKNDSVSECDNENEDVPTEPVVSDSDTIPYVPDLDTPVFEESKHVSPPAKRGKLITKTYGVKKPGKKMSSRKYTCPSCSAIYDSVALLNRHFKDTHPPLQCKVCDKFVNTPSTLTWHLYSHKDLKFSCDFCHKKFAFESDHDTHHISHRKIKTFFCNKPKYGKSFVFEGDLTKHVKTHRKKPLKCKLCDYTSKDQRNLKAHQRVHSNLLPYICDACLHLFKYNEQLKRHRAKPKECVEFKCLATARKQSKSPEYWMNIVFE